MRALNKYTVDYTPLILYTEIGFHLQDPSLLETGIFVVAYLP
jgi:hypothetical protein